MLLGHRVGRSIPSGNLRCIGTSLDVWLLEMSSQVKRSAFLILQDVHVLILAPGDDADYCPPIEALSPFLLLFLKSAWAPREYSCSLSLTD